MYAEALIKKRYYCTEEVTGNLIDTHFEDKEVGDVVRIESKTEDDKLFRILCMKEPDYVMNIMASSITLDEIEGANTIIDFI